MEKEERRSLLAASKFCLEWKESEQDIFHRCSQKNISERCHISSLLWQETLKFHVCSPQLIYEKLTDPCHSERSHCTTCMHAKNPSLKHHSTHRDLGESQTGEKDFQSQQASPSPIKGESIKTTEKEIPPRTKSFT